MSMTAYAVPDNPLGADHPRYSVVKYLSKGATAFVTLAVDRQNGAQVALKFLERGPELAKSGKYVELGAEREIFNQHRLKHPHVIRLKEVFLTDAFLVLAMEYAAGGDLFQLVSQRKGLPEEEARWIFQQVVFAVDFCHKMGVTNRDIKLENILLAAQDSPRPLVKLADFGFSKDENCQSAPGSRVGTMAYLAPEVVTSVKGKSYDAKKSDVWSCGVVLYALCTGAYPFMRSEDGQLGPAQQLHMVIQRILRTQYTFPPDCQVSLACRDLVSKMLVADPLQRLSIEQVLRHPWTSYGLQPGMLEFNDSLLKAALSEPARPEVLDEVRAIVREAQLLPRQQQQHHEIAEHPQGEPEEMNDSSMETPSAYESDDWNSFEFHPV